MVPQTTAPTPSLAEMAEAVRGDNPNRLSDEECRYTLIWLLAYTQESGKRGDWTGQAIGRAMRNGLNARNGGGK